MIRSEDYRKAGGFDARFFAHNEEIDLCWRLRLMGRRIYCIPDSIVYHVGGGTLPKGNSMKTYLNFRNNLTMLYKNLPDKELRHVMIARWFLDYIAAWQMLLSGSGIGNFKAVFRARHDFRKWHSRFRPDREAMKKLRVVEDVEEHTRYSLLWKYYIKGIKNFSDL